MTNLLTSWEFWVFLCSCFLIGGTIGSFSSYYALHGKRSKISKRFRVLLVILTILFIFSTGLWLHYHLLHPENCPWAWTGIGWL